MKKVIIIGATGSIGNAVRQMFLNKTNAELTLFSRHANKLKLDDTREHAISGNVTDDEILNLAIKGQDLVFVALSGNMKSFAEHIIKAMDKQKVQRLVFITTMGIYQEIPAWLGSSPDPYRNGILRPFREAADLIEQSDLNYTIIRPGWYTNGPVNYEITQKGEPFGGHDVSRASIADYVVKLSTEESLDNRASVGINEVN